ncbi:MAG: MotA/TolQ/ExbB proton channel family protein [Deltaproteobacteria bacterium]|nr:MotA/TolQ/ExbB proton channel family protein [Deltaproteobacteria bacterium]MCB9785556.1 MotA/TolQ/ExbB proton channel family protein [Deltaproteobacteria bacterium]
MDAIAKAMSEGGIWMYIILATSIVGLGIMIERFVMLFFKYNINANAFMAQIQKLVMANSIDKAIKLCNAAPSAALARVIKAGLTRANKGADEIQNAVEEATLEVIPHIQRRTNALAAIANIATLMGLLGTIIGMIGAFADLANVAPDKRQEALGRNISLAMNTTAFGLIVAIPAMLAHVVLSGVTKKIIDEIDLYSVKLENLLISRHKPADRG